MDARGLKAIAAAAGIVALACAPAHAGTGAASFSVGNDCLEHQAFVAADEAAVDARLPDRYTPVRDQSSGRPVACAANG